MDTEYHIYIGWLFKVPQQKTSYLCQGFFFLILSPGYYVLILLLSSVIILLFIMFWFCFINVSSTTVCLKGTGRINFQTLFISVQVMFHVPLAIAFVVPFLEDSMAASAAFEAQPCVPLIFCNTAWKMEMSSWMTANELSVQ